MTSLISVVIQMKFAHELDIMQLQLLLLPFASWTATMVMGQTASGLAMSQVGCLCQGCCFRLQYI